MTGLILLLLSFAQSGTISGRIVQPDGKPAVGVRVAAVEVPGRVSMMSVTQTDAAGRYKLENIPPRQYTIQAGTFEAPNYFPGVTDPAKATVVTVVGDATLNLPDFTFAAWSNILKTTRTAGGGGGAMFSGKLREASGTSLLPNVVVVLTSVQSSARSMTSTDKEGAFEFPGLPAGQYSVQFFSPGDSGFNGNGYEQFQTSVVLNRGETLIAEIQLRLVMAAATARQRPDWYAPPPPRATFASMSPSMAFATQRIVDATPPVYPESARQANLKGSVALRLHIGKDGALMWARIQTASTAPIFARAVLDAVNQWHFQGFSRINNELIESETVVTFNFPPD
jgi:TonB family protein